MDAFGRHFTEYARALPDIPLVEVVAPWTVEVFPYLQPHRRRSVFHLVNYDRVESAVPGEQNGRPEQDRKVPIPVHDVACRFRRPQDKVFGCLLAMHEYQRVSVGATRGMERGGLLEPSETGGGWGLLKASVPLLSLCTDRKDS